MKLWILKPTDYGLLSNPGWVDQYDCAFGFVVAAESENEARAIASMEHGEEGRTPWWDSDFTSCVELTPVKKGVILRDFFSA